MTKEQKRKAIRILANGGGYKEALKALGVEAEDWTAQHVYWYVRTHGRFLRRAKDVWRRRIEKRVLEVEELIADGMRVIDACAVVGIDFRVYYRKRGDRMYDRDGGLSEARKMAGLPPLEVKEKMCLRCGKKFKAPKGFRLCYVCRKQVAEDYYDEYSVGRIG